MGSTRSGPGPQRPEPTGSRRRPLRCPPRDTPMQISVDSVIVSESDIPFGEVNV